MDTPDEVDEAIELMRRIRSAADDDTGEIEVPAPPS